MSKFDEELAWNIKRAAESMLSAKYVVALTGAGVSVESDIRPFRGPGGVWTEYGEPPMDGYQRFPGHYAMAELEKMGVLKSVITQNVDNLHRAAGTRNIAEIHGNFYLVRCIDCNTRYAQEEISLDELPPHCPKCNGIIKNDGVYFGEPIPVDVLRKCQDDVSKCDCMLLAGTSGLVYPSAGFPSMVKQRGGVLVEVDPYGTALTWMCDVVLQGKGGEVLPRLVDEIKARTAG